MLAALTERECAIVGLMTQRLSNREIAEKLYLSEGSVRQYVNQIYAKLCIEGEPRAKRKRLGSRCSRAQTDSGNEGTIHYLKSGIHSVAARNAHHVPDAPPQQEQGC